MSPLINKPPALSCFLIKENTPSENWERTRGLNGEGWKRICTAWSVRPREDGELWSNIDILQKAWVIYCFF